MTKWKFLLTVLCSFVAGAFCLMAVLVYVPRTTELNYNMRGFVISVDGEILEEFTMSATGKEYDFIIDRQNGGYTFSGNTPERVEGDLFYLFFDWSSSEILKKAAPAHFVRDYCIPNTKFVVGELLSYSSITDNFAHEYGILEPEKGVFYLYADEIADNAFILGITNPDADPLSVLKGCQSWVDLLRRPGLLPPAEN